MQQRSGRKRFYNFDYLTVKGCILCSIENKFVNVFLFFSEITYQLHPDIKVLEKPY